MSKYINIEYIMIRTNLKRKNQYSQLIERCIQNYNLRSIICEIIKKQIAK